MCWKKPSEKFKAEQRPRGAKLMDRLTDFGHEKRGENPPGEGLCFRKSTIFWSGSQRKHEVYIDPMRKMAFGTIERYLPYMRHIFEAYVSGNIPTKYGLFHIFGSRRSPIQRWKTSSRGIQSCWVIEIGMILGFFQGDFMGLPLDFVGSLVGCTTWDLVNLVTMGL